ncbi:hypothetical protein [Colwellia sp. MEBiC06753]
MYVNMFRLILSLVYFISISASATSSCSLAEYRQFDFWLGQWTVTNHSNNQISQSKISAINNGCGILEEYQTPSGYVGKSLNIYDKQRQLWHQTWIDNTGLLLQLEGKFSSGKMVLTGTTQDAEGNSLLNQISWQQLTDGKVNQVWQVSKDNGQSWQLLFDGIYTKQK